MKSLSMRRTNCNLDLCLSSPTANYYYDLLSSSNHTTSSSSYSPAAACTNNSIEGGGSGSSSTVSAGSPQLPLTIIFNGKVCVSDVTEFQARAILCHASRSREMDHPSTCTSTSTSSAAATTPCSSSLPPSPSLLLQSPTTATNVNDISMKRSLQRFLQKRKNRIQSISLSSHPYNKKQ